MPNGSLSQAQHSFMNGSDPTASTGIHIVSSATAFTKGAWVELNASTPFTAGWCTLQLLGEGTGTYSILLDIAKGTGGSEQLIVSDLVGNMCNQTGEAAQFYSFPLHIPQGTRLSARFADEDASARNLRMCMQLYPPTALYAFGAPSEMQHYGIDPTAEPGMWGVGVDTGATPHTDTAWVELTAATSKAMNWIVFVVQNNRQIINQDFTALADLAIGPAASEVEIISDVLFTGGNGCDDIARDQHEFPMFIPPGTRLSARARSSATALPGRLVYFSVHGV